MKIRSYLFLLIVLAPASVALGQDVLITPKQIIYKRSKPLSEDKARIIIDYPKVRSSSHSLARRIERSISFARVMNLNLSSEIGGDQWLEAAGFFVNYNKNGVLSLTLWMSGSRHFSSTIERRVVVDLKTGRPVTADSVFDNLDGVRDLVYKRQQTEIEQAQIDIRKLEGYSDFDGGRWFADSTISLLDLQEFSVSDDGVTFRYDYGFPRIMLPAQPDGVFLIPWRELKPFIRRRGLLGKLVY